ncbi:MAG: VIT1/CCC1 transporter family protein [Bacteroidetes bacterium]|nr:VIT1/CCC1 transporter family protein [Bacteroidota bacterium]
MTKPDAHILSFVLKSQKNEITEYYVYSRLSRRIKNRENAEILQKIAEEEKSHYHFFKQISGRSLQPNFVKVAWFYWITRLFGLTFGLKLMERGEGQAQDDYSRYRDKIPGMENIIEDETDHENQLIRLIHEEKLDYVDSIVLGLNDALVELTGTLAGLSFALQNTRLIALAGLITGVAAALSMASSEYLSKKDEPGGNNPIRSALYTGLAYIFTVIILILPYLLLEHYLLSLGLTVTGAILIIAAFNYYISVAKGLSFRKRFLEMAAISLGVALLSFGIGYLIKIFLGVEL